MAKFTIIKNRLTSGELTEKLKHRIESQEWQQGVARLENFIPMQHGGVKFRSGFRNILDLNSPYNDNAGKCTLIPFIVEKEATYLILISFDPYMRLYVYSDAYPFLTAIDTIVNLPYYNLDKRLDPDGFRYAQRNDILIITHISSTMQPIMVYRNENKEFYYNYWFDTAGFYKSSNVNKQLVVPYSPKNFDGDFTLTPSAVSGSITLTAKTGAGANNPRFSARTIGKWYRIIHGTTEGSCRVVDIPSIKKTVISVDYTTNTFTVSSTIPIASGQGIFFLGGDSVLPAELVSVMVSSEPYYMIYVDNTHFKIATTIANALADIAMDLTSSGTGTIYFFLDTDTHHQATASVSENFGGTTASDNWTESVFGADYGFPKLVTFFNQRTYFFSTARDRDYLFASRLQNYFHMMQEYFLQDINGDSDEIVETDRTLPSDVTGNNYFNYTKDDNTQAFSFAVGGGEAGDIQWVRSNSSFLQLGTLSDEHILYGNDGILGKLNIEHKIQTNEGGSAVNAIGINNVTLYINRNGKSLREFVYNEENGSFISNDVSFLSDDIIKHNFDGAASSEYNDIQFKYMQSQQSNACIWLKTSEKQLIGLVYDRIKGIRAWYRTTIGGTNAKVESIVVMPSDGGKRDSLFACISRTINGTTRYTVEKMQQDFEHPILAASDTGDICYYLDGGVFYVIYLPTNKIPNLDYLEGQTVSILINGIIKASAVVVSGELTLDTTYPAGTVIAIGLPYTGKMEFFPVEAGGDFGQATGLVKRVDRLMIGLWKTLGLKVSSDGTKYEDCDEITGYPYSAPTTTFTGDIIKYYDGDNSINERLYLKQDRPYPCYITSVFYRGVTHD